MKSRASLILCSLLIFTISCGVLPEKQNQNRSEPEKDQLGENLEKDSEVPEGSVGVAGAAEGQEVALEDSSGAAVAELREKLKLLVDQALAADIETQKFLANDFYLKASSASNMGDYVSAEVLLEQIYRLSPQDNFLGFRWGIELVRTNQISRSAEVLQEVFDRQKGRDEKVGLLLAGAYSSMDHHDRARGIYRKILSYNPKSEDACIFLIKSLHLSSLLADEQVYLEKCEKNLPKSGGFSYYRGKLALEAGNKQKAIEHFNQALRRDPSFYQAIIAKGMILEERNELNEAEKLYRSYLKNYPDEASVLARMVNLLFAQEKFEKVIPYAETLSTLDPEDLNLRVKLGILYSELQKYELAKVQFEEILRAVPDSDKVLYYLGALNQQTQNFAESLSYFGKIKMDSPLYPDSIMQMANIKSLSAIEAKLQGDSAPEKDFLSFIENHLEKDIPNRVELALIGAGHFDGQNSNEVAIDLLKKVKESENFGENHTYYLASLYEKERRFDESQKLIEGILEKNPQNPNALNFLGYSYLMRNENLEKAFSLISTAVQLAPKDGYIRDSLGWYYFTIGDYQKALQELQHAYQLTPNDPTVTKHLAMAYQKVEDYTKAKKYFVEALKNSQQPTDRDDILKAVQELESSRSPAALNP